MESKYLNLFETIQNFSNQTIDTETVDRQAKVLKKMEETAGIAIYSYLNDLDDQHFTSKDNGDIVLKLSKNEISDLVNSVITKLDDNGSVVALIGEIDGSTQKAAKKKWNNAQKKYPIILKSSNRKQSTNIRFQININS